MKPTHLYTPRTLAQGHFAHGYTTEPVGRARKSLWPRMLAILVVIAAASAFLVACGTVTMPRCDNGCGNTPGRAAAAPSAGPGPSSPGKPSEGNGNPGPGKPGKPGKPGGGKPGHGHGDGNHGHSGPPGKGDGKGHGGKK